MWRLTMRANDTLGVWTVTAALILAGIAFVASPVEAQVKYCGSEEVRGIFHNPDLRPGEDGKVHSSGRFFVQFQVLGPRAAEAEYLLFSFGENMPSESMERCDPEQYPLTGIYLPGYRAATDSESGFFIPINTTLVADGEVYSSVAVYNKDDEYLGHGYVKSVVENGCAIPCGAALRAGLITHDEIRANDKIMPWPWVLPGDGVQVHDVGGLTIEFAEDVAEVRAWIQEPGEAAPREITDELEDWTPPERPDDLAPYPYSGSVSTRVWGSGYHWPNEVPDGAIVKVWAVDLNGNEGEKIVHVGSPTAGGIVAVEAPELRLTTPVYEKRAAAGGSAEFEVLLQNVGQGEAHADLRVAADENVSATVTPPHAMVPSGEDATVTIEMTAPANTPNGRYDATLVAEYKSGSEVLQKDVTVTLIVGDPPARDAVEDPAPANDTGEDATTSGTPSQGNGIPAAGPFLVLAMLVIAATGMPRRS